MEYVPAVTEVTCYQHKGGVVTKCRAVTRGMPCYGMLHRGSFASRAILAMLLMTKGDIESNPGPYSYPRAKCGGAVAKTHCGLYCDDCNQWFHIACANVIADEYVILCDSTEHWFCSNCTVEQRQQRPVAERKRHQTPELRQKHAAAETKRHLEQTPEQREQHAAAKKQRRLQHTQQHTQEHHV